MEIIAATGIGRNTVYPNPFFPARPSLQW